MSTFISPCYHYFDTISLEINLSFFFFFSYWFGSIIDINSASMESLDEGNFNYMELA